MTPRTRQRARWRRLAKRVARVVVTLFVIVGIFASSSAPAFAAIAAAAATPTCHCPHDSGERRACPCCARDDSTGCLPVGDSCSPHNALAPAVAQDELIPLPALTGIVDLGDVPELRGRAPHLRIERPPRS